MEREKIIYLISAILIGKSITKLILDKLINFIPYKLFISTEIPSVTEDLAKLKVYDFFEWVIFFIFTIFVFFVINFLQKKLNRDINQKQQEIYGFLYLLVCLILFLSTHFSTHSAKVLIGIFALFNILYWLSFKLLNITTELKICYKTMINGFLVGLSI